MPAAVEENLAIREAFEEEHERTVREEIERFRAKAAGVLAGTITDDEFRPFRLRYGIYGQRQPGVQMVRTKIPGGMLTAAQLERLAEIADEFGGGRGHTTTRPQHLAEAWERVAPPDVRACETRCRTDAGADWQSRPRRARQRSVGLDQADGA